MVSLHFFIDIILPASLWPRGRLSLWQEYFLGGKCVRCVGLAILSSSRADCHEIWEPQPPGALKACLGGLFYLIHEFPRIARSSLLTLSFVESRSVFCSVWHTDLRSPYYFRASWWITNTVMCKQLSQLIRRAVDIICTFSRHFSHLSLSKRKFDLKVLFHFLWFDSPGGSKPQQSVRHHTHTHTHIR